jgi:NitT/TauT family transport system substrate-binding protein
MPRRAIVVIVAAITLLAACGPGGSSTAPSEGVVDLKVGLGYIPSVQFAPFYLADQKGYYRQAGLKVTFENKIDPDLVTLVGQGALDLGVADRTRVIPAVRQGIPIQYVSTIYGTFPSIVFAKTSSGITSAADLAGKKIGIPGKYGSSWIMLQALLDSAGLKPDDVTIVEYPDFGQGVAVQQGAVDAATGFTNNEPVQLERTGIKATVLHVDQIVALPGPGLIAGTSTLQSRNAAVAAFVAATLRAMEEIAATPKVGLDAAVTAVPELASDRDAQAAILDATIATWHDPTGAKPFGSIDRNGWQASVTLLTKLGLVPNPVTVDGLVQEVGIPPAS